MKTETWKIPATLLAAVMAAPLALAEEKAEVVIRGQPFSLDVESFKCEIGDTPDISTKRLVGCDSAELIELSHDDFDLKAVRFEIRPHDPKISDGTRAELRDMHEAVNGEETWYRFASLLPEDFAIDSPHRLVISQWHERVREGHKSLRPPISHRLWNGRFVVTLWYEQLVEEKGLDGDGEIIFERPSLERGVLHEFAYKVLWSSGADGEIVAWKRTCDLLADPCTAAWREIIRHEGANGYDSADVRSYYFKLGLYTVTDFEVPYVAYHKGYHVGTSAKQVGLDDPMFR